MTIANEFTQSQNIFAIKIFSSKTFCESDRNLLFTNQNNVFLSRTGVNPDLFWKGKLSEVFESPHVLKIMHASTNDCFSLYRDGVKVWNVYDTAGKGIF